MKQTEIASKASDAEALLINLLDDSDFQSLSMMEEQFNIFDALGTRRQELRHSDFLSYILDPNRPHGLGDNFLRDFLLDVTQESEIDYPQAFHGIPLRIESLDDVQVSRERLNIDILLRLPEKWLVVIENKVGAKEHGKQLIKYEEQAKTNLGGLPTLFIYLTPNGQPASRRNWLPVSYSLVHKLAKKWSDVSSTSAEVKTALSDYADYLEGHVLEDSKVAELCRSIYKRHKQAIDLLSEHVPTPKDFYLDLAQEVMDQLAKERKVALDSKYRKVNRFYDRRLETLLPQVAKKGAWTESGKGLLFEWEIDADHLRVDLVIGPMSDYNRQYVVESLSTQENLQLLKRIPDLSTVTKVGKRWAHFTKTPVIPFAQIYDDMELESTDALINDLKVKVEKILDVHYNILRAILSK